MPCLDQEFFGEKSVDLSDRHPQYANLLTCLAMQQAFVTRCPFFPMCFSDVNRRMFFTSTLEVFKSVRCLYFPLLSTQALISPFGEKDVDPIGGRSHNVDEVVPKKPEWLEYDRKVSRGVPFNVVSDAHWALWRLLDSRV